MLGPCQTTTFVNRVSIYCIYCTVDYCKLISIYPWTALKIHIWRLMGFPNLFLQNVTSKRTSVFFVSSGIHYNNIFLSLLRRLITFVSIGLFNDIDLQSTVLRLDETITFVFTKTSVNTDTATFFTDHTTTD